MVKYRSMSNLSVQTKSVGLLFRLINILLRKYFFSPSLHQKKIKLHSRFSILKLTITVFINIFFLGLKHYIVVLFIPNPRVTTNRESDNFDTFVRG